MTIERKAGRITPSGQNGHGGAGKRFFIRTRHGFWSGIGIPARGAELHNAIGAGFDFPIMKRLTEATGIPAARLMQSTKISPASFERRRQEGRFNTQESDRLYRFAEAFNAAVQLFEGDTDAAREWMTKPVLGLGGQCPIDMLKTTAEFESVMDLIGRLEHGVAV